MKIRQNTLYRLLLISMILICQYAIADIAEDMQAFQRADDLRADGKIHESLAIYEDILKKSPNTELKDEILTQMASCYIQIGDEDSAIKSYLQIISSDPNGANASNAVTLMANLFTQRYRYEDLVAISKQIIQQFPNTESAAMASYRIANYLYSKGDNQNAIKGYKDFLIQYPKSMLRISALNRLIYLYINENMFAEAEETIKDILAENPNNTYILNQLGLVYRKQGKYDEALALYQKLISINPKDVDVYEQIGEIYYEKGDKERAILEWQKITANNADQYYYFQMLANIFKSHGLYDLAVQEYEKAIDKQPLASYIYNQLAELHIINKNYDSAMDVYLKALMALPANYPDRTEIVNSLLELSKANELRDKVISKLKSQLEKTPSNTSAVSALADIYFFDGQFVESIELYKKLALLSPENRNLMLERAEWLRREKKLENAIDMYNAILDINANVRSFIDIQIFIGQLQSELGKSEEAVKSLKFAVSKAREMNDRKSNEQRVSALMMIGNIYLNQLHDAQNALLAYQEAETILKFQTDMITENSELYLKMAEIYRIMGNFDMALKSLDAISFRSSIIEAKIAKIQGDCYFNMGDFDNAKAQYTKSIERNLKEDWANDVLDRLMLIDECSKGNLREQLKIYSNVDRIRETGDFEKALSEYDNAIKAYPTGSLTERIKFDKGELLDLIGKYKEAIQTYEGLISLNSQFAPEAQFRIAGVYSQKLNDNKQAIEAYSKLIRNYPDSILIADARKQLKSLSNVPNLSEQNLP